MPYSLEEFWAIVTTLAEDVKQCSMALEILDNQEPIDEDMVRFWRKICAYTIFALIEGVTYHMLHIAYVARHSRDVVFTLAEIEALESAYDFSEDRHVEPGRKDKDIEPGLTPAQMLDRIKFAFNAFARVYYSDYIMPVNESGWSGIKLALLVKSGLAHPQSAAELEVADEYVTEMLLSTPWFMQCLIALTQDCRDCAEQRLAIWEAAQDEPIM
ncbi:MAG TPA: hypothetical protein VGC89_10100 [Pyrinomonadaceae bacterium]